MNDIELPNGFALALDVGGTFTDVILAARDGSAFWVTKSPSVPSNPADGFFGGVDKVLSFSGVAAEKVGVVLHGSTVATNAILENKGAKTGLVTTAGFRHVLEIGRADIPRKANLFGWLKPKRPVPPRHVFEIGERVRVDGSVARPLDETGLDGIADAIRRADLKAVAIVFLHSYMNPEHERRTAEALSRRLPGVDIAISSEVLPVFREYERALATIFNASVQPLAGRYVGRLAAGLAERQVRAPFFIMKSNGGVFPPDEAARYPVNLALSGPAAGAKGAAYVGRLAGFENIVTIDMGGTSADVALIRNGAPETATTGRVGEFPLALAMIDIHTIGAGGGSIASLGHGNALQVGPESAGADPGPAAYGRGGDRPTVTDANLLLGRIPPHLLDGEMALHPERSRQAIDKHIAHPLGLDTIAAANGIIEIVDNNMVGALKVMSVERGLDPSDFTLCAFGGAGPVHGARLMRLIGCPRLLVPRYPGILCAMGLIATDLKYDFVVTRLQRPPDYDLSAIKQTFDALMQQAAVRLGADSVPEDRRRYARFADLRYANQGVELTVAVPEGEISRTSLDAVVEAFHALHERLYTFAERTTPVEIVNFRVEATGLMDHVRLPEIPTARPGERAQASSERMASLDGAALVRTPIYRREALLAGHVISGPAIIDQLDSTTVVLPGQSATTDRYGNLIIEEAA